MAQHDILRIEEARSEIVRMARRWREAECCMRVDGEYCFGDNHQHGCPVETARQDLIATLNHLDKLEGR